MITHVDLHEKHVCRQRLKPMQSKQIQPKTDCTGLEEVARVEANKKSRYPRRVRLQDGVSVGWADSRSYDAFSSAFKTVSIASSAMVIVSLTFKLPLRM